MLNEGKRALISIGKNLQLFFQLPHRLGRKRAAPKRAEADEPSPDGMKPAPGVVTTCR
jgi:hypothetical protein